MKLNSIEELIEEIRAGRIVILMDDEDRENEGDLVVAAECIRAEDVNFMARYGRGLVCLTLTRNHCRRLNLPLMARNFYSDQATNFTVSIEAAEGVTTGISAADRALTIRKAAAPDAQPSDLVQPGHVFPLMAHPGGVLSRAGHTEAGCDLARIAGFQPAAAIVEILNDDGSMARRADLETFARDHKLKIGTIADLIRFRIETEKTIERVAESELSTEFGKFRLVAYRDSVKDDLHFALVKGDIRPDRPILVRVHLENPIYDLTGSLAHSRRWPIVSALERISREECAVFVVLCNQFEPEALIDQIRKIGSREEGEPGDMRTNSRDQRTIGLGSQILSDLGVRKMVVMSSPKRFHALSGFGLEVVDYITS
ncbi:MAG: bifunctional 3,4-dihydroxy-2-butanone-4-phosphate synthase/GTP cyclohydrolase II [Gammaproteobacteria bacterium]